MAINDPRDIPGLVGWYSAEAETGYANGAEMTQWTDLSGNGNHLTAVAGPSGKPLWQSTSGPSSGPAVRFQSTSRAVNGGYFTFPSTFLSGAAAGEIAVQIKSDGVDCSQWFLGTSGNSAHYPYGAAVYESFGMSSSFYSFTPTMSITTWRRYSARAAAAAFSAYLDGTLQGSKSTGTVAWSTANKLGRNAYGFGGYMSLVVVYSRVLTTAERADLDTWMVAHPSGGTTAAASATGTISGVLPPLSSSLAGSSALPVVSGAVSASLPSLSANLSGETYPPGVAGDLAAVLPALSADLAGTSAAPIFSGTLAATLPALRSNLAGQSFGPGTEGYLDAVLPGLSASLSGRTDARNGFGLVLASTATVSAETPLVADSATVPLHIIATSVPVPTLVAGRPS